MQTNNLVCARLGPPLDCAYIVETHISVEIGWRSSTICVFLPSWPGICPHHYMLVYLIPNSPHTTKFGNIIGNY